MQFQHGYLLRLVRFLKLKVLQQRNQLTQAKAQLVDLREWQSYVHIRCFMLID